jgi:hypothetical protein
MVSIWPIVSPMVPSIFMTPYNYPMGHNSHSFVTENGRKLLKNMFFGMITSKTCNSAYKYVLWANEWCLILL